MKTQEEGSITAKQGFKNEDYVISKFNSWQNDSDAQQWLVAMDYDLKEIDFVKAEKVIGNYKADIQVQVTIKLKKCIDAENIQVKLVSNKSDTGEVLPIRKTKDIRRTLANEFSQGEQELLLNWIENNKSLIVSDILKGRGRFAAEMQRKGGDGGRDSAKMLQFKINPTQLFQ